MLSWRYKKMRKLVVLAIIFFLPTSALALELQKPIDCEMGTDCFIQNYVDMEPKKEGLDFRCGYLSYNENKGTDFRLKNYVQMEQGVTVLAAAKGRVIGVRDGFEDININDINPETIKGQECGNGIVIDHGDGWKTQYCNMMKNSLYVKKGQEVKAGEKLGKIGLSGDTSYPRLTFYVRNEGDYIDPFSAKNANEGCQPEKPEFPLWSEKALKSMPLVDSAILGIGFSGNKPDGESARKGKYDDKTISSDSEMLVFWADIMGLQPNDVLILQIIGPDGKKVIEHQKNFIEPKAQQFYFTGKKIEEDGSWTPGIYQGKLTLIRTKKEKSETVLKKTIETYLR